MRAFERKNGLKKHTKTYEYYDFIAVFVQYYHMRAENSCKFRLK